MDTGEVDDVLRVELADGRPAVPRELAGLVHSESVAIREVMCRRRAAAGRERRDEGTVVWKPTALQLLRQLADSDYREVSIVGPRNS